MRFSSTSTAGLVYSLVMVSTASARIIGLAAPATIAAGQPFTVSLLTENYIQSVYDVAVAFGIAYGSGFPGSLGTIIGSDYLGPDESNTVEQLNFTVSVDKSTLAGPATLSASIFSLYGAASGPTLVPFNVSVTVGDTASAEIVKSS